MMKENKLIQQFLLLVSIYLFLASCAPNLRSLNGRYVNVENIYNEYYVFDKKNASFTYYYSDKIGKGKFYTNKSTLFLKTDSLYKYNNLDIGYPEYSDTAGVDDTHGIISIDKLSFQKFKDKNPTLSLFFIGFRGIESRKLITNPTLILELKSGENIYKIDDNDEIVNDFKVIGLHNKCLPSRGIYDCELFDISFKTKIYGLMFGGLGPKIEISLESIANKNLSQYRFIRAIDSFESKKQFYFDGKTFKKIERLQGR